jgi:iron complex outermembrane recepter protein
VNIPHLSTAPLRILRVLAIASLFHTSTALMFAQATGLQTISTEESQTGSQTATPALDGTVSDAKGGLIAHATLIIRSDATGRSTTVTADAAGHFAVANLPAGSYTVDASAPGFAPVTRKGVQIASQDTTTQPTTIAFSLQIASATADITVDADATHSIAATLAPMDALLAETSARTEITPAFINNFTSPVSDYGEAVEMAPGTFTTNGNGVGLGQSKTYFRGFPDGDYDIDFDGIPFYDTNTPTHHSWAFFPAQFLGGIDFDRSPGTASTIGPAPFGGSIHLLSKELSPLDNVRATFSGGSFNTYLYDAEYDSGTFGPGHKLNLNIDVHHLQSDGYQTNNNQTRNAGAIKFQYKISPQTVLTGFSGVIWLDANTPNFAATRCQMYGAPAGAPANFCAGSLAPFTGAGINFLLTDNSDPLNYLNKEYNYYHVPTDFEYVGLHSELAHHITFDVKPYTYNYDNSEKYTNATTITEDPTLGKPCNMPVIKKGVTALPCGVDKYNSYRKYGEASEVDQISEFGTLRAGFWYEWANTNRHQYPSDPLTHWTDQALPNFAEKFVTDSYQPFVEYQFNVGSKLKITPGVKFSYYTVGTQQFADDGKTIGGLVPKGVTPNPAAFIANGGSYFATLPAIVANYRLRTNWSVYGQLATGSIVPPSSVFDFNQGPTGQAIAVKTLPKQQKSTTYQGGTVLKLKNVTLDADYYHIRFQNSYSNTFDSANEPIYFLQPSSITQGVEGESNIAFGHGLSAYLNATYGKATYVGSIGVACVSTDPTCTASAPQISVAAPSGQNVQQTPSDTETEGITYQRKALDIGLFNKRVGTFYIDNGQYHNQATIDPFTLTNLFFNYTLRTGGRFDNTKLRLSFNNLFDEHNITGDSIAGGALTTTLAANGTTYTNPFLTQGQTPIAGGDNLSVLPGRSIMFSVTFGLSPHGR